VRECPVYVRSIAIATGAAIPTNHDNNRTNREVNRSVMDDICLAASPERNKKTNKQSEKKWKRLKPLCFYFCYQNWHKTEKKNYR